MTPRGVAGGIIFFPGNGVFGYHFLAVVSGYEYETSDLRLRASATILQGSIQGNSGISAIIPAYQLKDLLEGPALQRQRDEAVAAQNRSK